MHAQQVELEKMFGHVPGISMELPLLAFAEEKGQNAAPAQEHRQRHDLRECLQPGAKVNLPIFLSSFFLNFPVFRILPVSSK
jgi:hypothetical protein